MCEFLRTGLPRVVAPHKLQLLPLQGKPQISPFFSQNLQSCKGTFPLLERLRNEKTLLSSFIPSNSNHSGNLIPKTITRFLLCRILENFKLSNCKCLKNFFLVNVNYSWGSKEVFDLTCCLFPTYDVVGKSVFLMEISVLRIGQNLAINCCHFVNIN